MVKRAFVVALIGDFGQAPRAFHRIEQAEAREHRKPNHDKARGHHHRSKHKFAQGSAFGNLGEKHAHKRRPGDPPHPIRHRIPHHPIAVVKHIQFKRMAHGLGEDVANRHRYRAQKIMGRADDKDKQQQHDRKINRPVAEKFHALINRQHRTEGIEQGQRRQHRRFPADRVKRHAGDDVQA